MVACRLREARHHCFCAGPGLHFDVKRRELMKHEFNIYTTLVTTLPTAQVQSSISLLGLSLCSHQLIPPQVYRGERWTHRFITGHASYKHGIFIIALSLRLRRCVAAAHAGPRLGVQHGWGGVGVDDPENKSRPQIVSISPTCPSLTASVLQQASPNASAWAVNLLPVASQNRSREDKTCQAEIGEIGNVRGGGVFSRFTFAYGAVAPIHGAVIKYDSYGGSAPTSCC